MLQLENALAAWGALGNECITKDQTIKGFREPLHIAGPNDVKYVIHCSSHGVSILCFTSEKAESRKTKRLDQAITKQGFNHYLLITMALLRSHGPRLAVWCWGTSNEKSLPPWDLGVRLGLVSQQDHSVSYYSLCEGNCKAV